MYQSFKFEITIAADEWAYTKRRLTYLEALLLRIVRDEKKVREWFPAGDLAVMRLPGLPATPQGIRSKASSENWMRRKAIEDGHWMYFYHVGSLPARAFDALIARLADLPPIDSVVPMQDLLPPPPEAPCRWDGENDSGMAPPWVLPLMRIMRKETNGDLGAAWDILPERLPPNIDLPSVDEAAHILVALGLAGSSG